MKRVIVNDLLNEIRRQCEVTKEQLERETENLYLLASHNKVGNKIMAQVPLYMVAIDNTYQRTETFSKQKGDEIALNFIEEAYDPIKLNLRNGIFYCPAGQHRIYAHIRMGRQYITSELFSVSYEQEVHIYLSQDDNRSKLSPYDRYKAGLAAGRREDVLLHNICMKYNISITSQRNGKELSSISTAKRILNTYGSTGLEWVCEILDNSGWTGEKKGLDSRIFRALKNIYRTTEGSEKAKSDISAYMIGKSPMQFFAASIAAYPERDMERALTNFLLDIVNRKRTGKGNWSLVK